MKLSFITPTNYIGEFESHSDFILALSHLIDLEIENEYEKAIKSAGKEIILDNGLFENHTPEPIESLIKKAEKIGASTFFAPDVLFDSKKTKEELLKAIKLVKEKNSKLKIAAVVQASNKEEYVGQLIDFNLIPEVSLIGLSILSIPKSFGLPITESRIELLQQMKNQNFIWTDCHLLGIGDSYRDVVFAAKNCPFVVSNDSSSAFQTALFSHSYDDELNVVEGKVKEKVDFGLKEVEESVLQNVHSNIIKIKNIIK